VPHHAHRFALSLIDELAEAGLGLIGGKSFNGWNPIVSFVSLIIIESFDSVKFYESWFPMQSTWRAE